MLLACILKVSADLWACITMNSHSFCSSFPLSILSPSSVPLFLIVLEKILPMYSDLAMNLQPSCFLLSIASITGLYTTVHSSVYFKCMCSIEYKMPTLPSKLFYLLILTFNFLLFLLISAHMQTTPWNCHRKASFDWQAEHRHGMNTFTDPLCYTLMIVISPLANCLDTIH